MIALWIGGFTGLVILAVCITNVSEKQPLRAFFMALSLTISIVAAIESGRQTLLDELAKEISPTQVKGEDVEAFLFDGKIFLKNGKPRAVVLVSGTTMPEAMIIK